MLLFYTSSPDTLDEISRQGIRRPVRLITSFKTALDEGGVVLVVNPLKLMEEIVWYERSEYQVEGVPPAAIENLNPHLETIPIAAGGGYVIRDGRAGIEVLMIFRKGVWDLPKGKLDAGESIEQCALREVREEVGIRYLTLGVSLGETVHGYERKGAYWVKTTHWYAMTTPEESFKPQAEEQIEAVAWMPWAEAVEKIGYEIFRRHMKHVECRLQNVEGLM